MLVMGNLLWGCSPPERKDLRQGIDLEKKRQFVESMVLFDHAILRNPTSREAVLAAKEGAKVSFYELKDFKKAAEYNQHIVLASQLAEERMIAQKQLATIYFDHLADYSRAIAELSKVLNLDLSPADRAAYQMRLAKAYFFQNNFSQAESEANQFIRQESKDSAGVFEMYLLKGNVALAKKDMAHATEIFQETLKKFPERAVKENVAMTLAVAYEEMKDYKKAVAVLQEMRPYHPHPDYIDLRIRKLNEAQKNQPGANGIRRK